MFFKKKVKAHLVKYPNPMTYEDMAKVLSEYGEGDKIWQALDTLMDNLLLDAVNEVSDHNNDAIKFAHAGGRIEALSTMKAKLEEAKSWKTGKNYSRAN